MLANQPDTAMEKQVETAPIAAVARFRCTTREQNLGRDKALTRLAALPTLSRYAGQRPERTQLNAFNSKLLSRTAGEGASPLPFPPPQARKRGRVRVGLGG